MRLRAAVNAMTYTAIQTTTRTSDFTAGFDICGTGRNSLAARSANDKVLGQSGCPGFQEHSVLDCAAN
jgi:hypothetical protein